jgi:type IV secretion system protein VirD4
LGKETIDTNTFGKSSGRSGNYSTNYQISGRELLTPDEVRMLDNQYAILFIRGERPVMDFKYDILKHPNVAFTADGKAGVYRHGEVTSATSRSLFWILIERIPKQSFRKPTTSEDLRLINILENIT